MICSSTGGTKAIVALSNLWLISQLLFVFITVLQDLPEVAQMLFRGSGTVSAGIDWEIVIVDNNSS